MSTQPEAVSSCRDRAGTAQAAEPYLIPRRPPLPTATGWLMIIIVVGADLAAFYAALEGIFNSRPWLVWVAAAGFAVASAGTAHQVGTALGYRLEGLARYTLAWPVTAFLSWLTLGVAAFVVRLHQAHGGTATVGSAARSGFGGASAAAVVDPADWNSALVMGALYLAGGVLAGWLGYRHATPTADALHAAKRSRLRAQRAYEKAQDRLAEATKLVVNQAQWAAVDQAAYAAAVQERAAWARDLMNAARGLMAERAETLFDISVTETGPVAHTGVADVDSFAPLRLFATNVPAHSGAGLRTDFDTAGATSNPAETTDH